MSVEGVEQEVGGAGLPVLSSASLIPLFECDPISIPRTNPAESIR